MIDATFVRLEDNEADILTKNTSEEFIPASSDQTNTRHQNNQVNNRMDFRTLVLNVLT
jgi:hypothetical protein